MRENFTGYEARRNRAARAAASADERAADPFYNWGNIEVSPLTAQKPVPYKAQIKTPEELITPPANDAAEAMKDLALSAAELQEQWKKLTEEQRQQIRQQNYAKMMARDAESRRASALAAASGVQDDSFVGFLNRRALGTIPPEDLPTSFSPNDPRQAGDGGIMPRGRGTGTHGMDPAALSQTASVVNAANVDIEVIVREARDRETTIRREEIPAGLVGR
jgi:hypothetical protein